MSQGKIGSICVLALFVLVIALACATLPAAAQTETVGEQVPAVTHNTWTSGAAIPTPVWAPAGTGVLTNNIYVVGGQTTAGKATKKVQVYDPATDSWSTGVSLPEPVAGAASAVVKNVLYVLGGTSNASSCDPLSKSVWAYSIETKKWTSKTAMPTARCAVDAVVANNIIYVIGGYNGSALATVESYNPATDKWTEEASLLEPKNGPAVGVFANKTIVAAGGWNGSVTSDVEAYDIATNSWKELESDTTARNAQCYGVVGSDLYDTSGGAGGSSYTLNESFSLARDTWTTLSPIPQGTAWAGSVVYKGKLYCIGGLAAWPNGPWLNKVQIYQP